MATYETGSNLRPVELGWMAMPIPERFKRRLSDAEVAQFIVLCNEIEEGVQSGADVSAALARWNRRSGRIYTPSEFTTYYGATTTETFVRTALLTIDARMVDDLTYPELEDVLSEVLSGRLSEADGDFYIAWLAANLPGASLTDLIFYPDVWFGYGTEALHDLSPREILAYAMHRAGRVLPDAPSLELPVPHPGTPAGDAARRAALVEEAQRSARRWAQARSIPSWVEAKQRQTELEAILAKLPREALPELNELVQMRGEACLRRMRELGLIASEEQRPGPVDATPPQAPERVYHSKFGVGIVKSREGSGTDEKLTVVFDVGEKRLAARFVKALDDDDAPTK